MGKLALVLVEAVLTGIVLAHTHSHEAPHSKYGREINEQAAQEALLVSMPTLMLTAILMREESARTRMEANQKATDTLTPTMIMDTHAKPLTAMAMPTRTTDTHMRIMDIATKPMVMLIPTLPPREKPSRVTFLSFMNDPKTRIWVHAIGATLLVSAVPCFILMFIPIQTHNAESDPLLKVLLAFGSGGLLGDAFLHLIPHATPSDSGHAHSHSHSEAGHGHSHDNSVGGWVLGGIIAFLVVEKLVRILRGGEGHSHSHGHSHDKKSAKSSESEKKKDDKSSKAKAVEPKQEEGIKVAAYLNLVADFTHNFTDGLAIGASFLAGPTVGFVTMLTVLVHEVPHEIGDFAILIQSGYTKYKAMGIQLVTALAALSGCVLSLWVADSGDLADAAAHSWVLPFTAGGFIYIATVSVIPRELLHLAVNQGDLCSSFGYLFDVSHRSIRVIHINIVLLFILAAPHL